jgi:hypothetical protein
VFTAVSPSARHHPRVLATRPSVSRTVRSVRWWGPCQHLWLRVAVVAIGVMSGTLPAAAADQDALPANSGTPSTAPQPPLPPMLPPKNLRDPFARLFMKPAPHIGAATGRNVRLDDPQRIHQRRVGPCGMVMFESLHDVDPRMRRQVPPGEFAIRAVVPKTCSEK